MPRLVASHGPRANPTPGEARGSATFVAQVFPLELPQVVRATPLQDLSCDPARRLQWVPWRRCSHDRPYLALRARQAWPPSLAPPPVPLALPRRAAQLQAIGVLHRATGPTPQKVSQVLPSELEPSVALQCVNSCLDDSDKIGSQIRNSRGLDIADVVGVVVDGSREVLTSRPSNRALERAHGS